MQITEVSSEALKKTYRIVVEAADLARETETELKALGQKVKIPGFRPGHIPMKVLQQRYGKGIQGDVIKNAINAAATEAVQKNKLRPSMQPDVNVEDYKEDGDLVFTMTVETLPEVPELKFDSVTLERETFDVDDKEVDEAITRLAERSPKLTKLEGGEKVAKGNVVGMDFKGMVDGKPFEGGTAENFSIEIGSGRLIDTFEDQLIGLKVGDEKKVNVTFPENYFSKELAGKPAVFEVKVKEISRMDAPEINEEFAKVRGFADLRALKEAIRNQIIKEYDAVVRTRMKKQLFDALEGKCDYPLPQKMVDAEFETIWSRLQQAKQQSPNEDVYEGRKEDEVKDEYRKIAERRVRLGILLAEIGNRQKLQVSREEMTQAIMQQAQQFPGQEQAVFDFYRKNPGRLDELRGPILEEKAVDWILSQVKLNDKKVPTSALKEDEEEEGKPESGAKKASAAKGSAKKSSTGKKKSGDGDNE